VIAPDTIRIVVKLAGSIPLCFNAMRQSKELPAKAIMANSVSNVSRERDMGRSQSW
jgi:hypothetical protein